MPLFLSAFTGVHRRLIVFFSRSDGRDSDWSREQGTLWVGSGLPALPQHQRFLTQREGEPMQALAALFEHADQFQPAVGLIGDAVRLGEEHIQPFAKRT